MPSTGLAKSRWPGIARPSEVETLAGEDLADRLAALGQAELDDINTFLDSVSGFECGALLVEACRCRLHRTATASPLSSEMPTSTMDVFR